MKIHSDKFKVEFFILTAPPIILAMLFEKEQLIISRVELIKLIAPPTSCVNPLMKLIFFKMTSVLVISNIFDWFNPFISWFWPSIVKELFINIPVFLSSSLLNI